MGLSRPSLSPRPRCGAAEPAGVQGPPACQARRGARHRARGARWPGDRVVPHPVAEPVNAVFRARAPRSALCPLSGMTTRPSSWTCRGCTGVPGAMATGPGGLPGARTGCRGTVRGGGSPGAAQLDAAPGPEGGLAKGPQDLGFLLPDQGLVRLSLWKWWPGVWTSASHQEEGQHPRPAGRRPRLSGGRRGGTCSGRWHGAGLSRGPGVGASAP